MLHIGSAQVDITPTQPFLMGGSFIKFQSQDVLDPLMASCIVADDGRTPVAIVSCDLCTLPRDLVLSIRAQTSQATGIPTESIHLAATHNHSGPRVRIDLPLAEDNESEKRQLDAVRRKLVADIVACIVEAHSRAVPARMGYGRGKFESGAFNRRFIMSNGCSRMGGGETENLKRLKAEGPADRELQVVWFETPDGRHLAVMVNYSSHPTNLYAKATVSADFPGVLRDSLQAVLGKGLPIVYLQGACGNIHSYGPQDPRFQRVGIGNARRVGRGLAGETLRIMGNNVADAEDINVSACSRILEIPYRDVLPLPVEQAREKWVYYRNHQDEFSRLNIDEKSAIYSTLYTAQFKDKNPAESVEVAAFALGDVIFVTNPAELFVEYQLEIKERGHKVIVTELTNGFVSYVPTRLACALGGFETILTWFDSGAGDLIRDASCEQIEKLMD